MRRPIFTALFTLFCLALLSTAGHAQIGLPVISSAVVDYSRNTLTVSGTNFGSSPKVTLGGVTLTAQTATATRIVANFPSTALPSSFIPGTYFLQITYSSGFFSIFTVGLGANGPIGINNRGVWSSTASYAAKDAVTDVGQFWFAIVANTSSEPTSTNPNWQLLAAQGNTGATGPMGPQGPIGPIGLQGLKGNTGATGAIGAQGPTGSTGAIGVAGPTGPIGAIGPAGAVGATGAIGTQGATGPAGANGTNGTGFNFTGPFNSATIYNQFDVATFNGSSYDATVGVPAGGFNPDINPSWALMAQAGAVGAAGAVGPQGPMGFPGATGATGTTGAVGPQGQIGLTGTTGANGAPGPKGDFGATGAAGSGSSWT
jgi:hypothetical protein